MNTLQGDRLDVLVTTAQAFEQQGIKPKDLEPMIGLRSRMNEWMSYSIASVR